VDILSRSLRRHLRIDMLPTRLSNEAAIGR
jgi:hypothetical protein